MFQLTIGDKRPEPYDWIHKLAELASALSWLSWPIVIIVLAVIFREPIKHVVRNIRTAEAPGGFKATVGEQLQDIRTSVDRAEKAGDADLTVPKMAFDEARPQLVVNRVDPFETVIKAWNSVEAALRQISGRERPLTSAAVMIRDLVASGRLTTADAGALDGLRQLRNTVVHHPEAVRLDQEQAIEFAQSAERMVMRLRLIGRT